MIPFSKPYSTGNELKYINDAIQRQHLSGDGYYTKMCSNWLERELDIKKVLLTHSCTAALEMAAILLNITEGDEIIMPSYTFVSTANAFVLRGGIPVFVDIRKDTKNIDENLIELAITSKTKAIVVVHYAGVACEMDTIKIIAKKYKLIIIEDAAQALGSKYKGQNLGTIGDIGCMSFHETKNIISGEGGAIFINNEALISRSEIIREKGTNRSQFFRGYVDKYTWVDIGSSYLPSEIIAAFLYAQLEKSSEIINSRIKIWEKYYLAFQQLKNENKIKLPLIPNECIHNGHIFYIELEDLNQRTIIINKLKELNILTVFHYIPLHSSPAGKKFGKTFGSMQITNSVSDNLLRLPLWIDDLDYEYVIKSVIETIKA
jgi:dTDP-4-amino-4,6-dideoxygalactose transaminase